MNSDVDLEALKRASRLQELGFVVRSPELSEQAQHMRNERGGNRAMRRHAAKQARKRSGSQ